MTDCPNATVRDQLPELLHGALDAPTRAGVEAHVAGCADCASELALLRAARATMARVPAVDVVRIVAALPRPVETGPRLVHFPTSAERARRRLRAPLVRWGGLAAAAVALAVGVGSLALRDEVDRGSDIAIVGAPTSPMTDGPGSAADPTPVSPATASGDAGDASLLVVNTAALSDADLAGLLDELDELEAVPAADPLSLVPVAELPMGAGEGS